MITKERRPEQEINSSSMADIAFLLLIFFLVTTTIMNDKGVDIILPEDGPPKEVNMKNIVNILVNSQGKVMMGMKGSESGTIISNISDKASSFISNNKNVIFSVKTDKRTDFQTYLDVLDQLKKANAQKISIANPDDY
tara:strand:- start:346 stop:759 length:414 start_codon:yes stop_codon:yes gene_type:complete